MNGTRHSFCVVHERTQQKYTAGDLINGAGGVFNCIVVRRAGLCASDLHEFTSVRREIKMIDFSVFFFKQSCHCRYKSVSLGRYDRWDCQLEMQGFQSGGGEEFWIKD